MFEKLKGNARPVSPAYFGVSMSPGGLASAWIDQLGVTTGTLLWTFSAIAHLGFCYLVHLPALSYEPARFPGSAELVTRKFKPNGDGDV